MGKVNSEKLVRRIKIKPALFLYVAIFFFIALIISVLTIQLFDTFVSTVAVYYIDANDDIDRINEDNKKDVRIALEMIDEDFDESDANAVLFYARNSTIAFVLILYFIIGIIIAARLFFRRKLDEPLRELSEAAQKISNENLDFKIEYSGSDEMGKLCVSFEKMRQQLLENNKKMWDMIDEQKRVYHIFSHDIRTPLTVTIGYFDILREYLPDGKLTQEKIEETLDTINNNLVRLERFVDMMSNMQKTDDIEINAEIVDLEEFFKNIKENAKMICGNIQFEFTFFYDTKTAVMDKMLIEQILLNIISNAMRYAEKCIDVDCKYIDGKLMIVVKDDGRGFSDEALKHAFDSYYTEEDKSKSEHFGIGLSICKKLCEKMNGDIICENDNGAKVTVYI